jgi:hypothetical protein
MLTKNVFIGDAPAYEDSPFQGHLGKIVKQISFGDIQNLNQFNRA